MTRRIAGEWEDHNALWLGFPSHEDLWQENLIAAQAEVATFARILNEVGAETVKLMVMGEAAQKAADSLLGSISGITIIQGRFGDIWFRDTGPIFGLEMSDDMDKACFALKFRNNGWGGKYILPHDDEVADQIAQHDQSESQNFDFILEGGALDHDGHGTVLTTRQCLLNPNRNPGWTEAIAEAALERSLGVKKIIWLDDGLLNDHTDGHVDNLARFVAPGVVVCPMAFGQDDPNAALYDRTAECLSRSTDVRGHSLQVVRLPSPGRITNEEGDIVPASHMNFLIANEAVIVPIYGQEAGEQAVEALQSLFPERKVLGLSSKAILTGGGSFHCITQQVPALRRHA